MSTRSCPPTTRVTTRVASSGCGTSRPISACSRSAEWSHVVRQRFATLLDPVMPEDLSDDDLALGVQWRVMHRGQVPSREAHPSALPVGDDLLALLSVRTGARISTPSEDL